ncbi:MAG: type II toxin-antitoxin system PrlF family antitoxin [Spirochaetaceae bacterium]|nr:type II toxin-antitoxin system PrlF family antitoxin [Spirochaetaceae bacterium]
MSIIHEVATMTAKGQITVPKPIRQALGADAGTKVTFELHGNGQISVSRADAEHEDPAIGAFLDLLERDIKAGRLIEQLPDGLARTVLEDTELDVDLHEPIEGDVDL